MDSDWKKRMRAKQSEEWQAEGPDFYDKNLRYETQKPGYKRIFASLRKEWPNTPAARCSILGAALATPLSI